MRSHSEPILLKLSGEMLGGIEKPINIPLAKEIVEAIKEVKDRKPMFKLGIVVGGGNIVRGRDLIPQGVSKQAAHFSGMLATIMNANHLYDLLIEGGVSAKLATPFSFGEYHGLFDKSAVREHLANGTVLVFGGGIGFTDVSTDTAAVHRAGDIGSRVVLKATDVDGVYDRDPSEKDRRFLAKVTYEEFIAQELGIVDHEAIMRAKDHDVEIRVFHGFEEGNIARALRGEDIGSVISAKAA